MRACEIYRTATAFDVSSAPMRWILLTLCLLAACGDGRCLPCRDAVSSGVRYECDAGACAVATAVYECTCRAAADAGLALWTFSATDTCDAAQASWDVFRASACP